MSALMEVDQRGRVVNYKLRETVIRSDERMTYTDVNKLLDACRPATGEALRRIARAFKTMEELARILIKMRERRGAIDFNLPEAVFEFDDEGRVAGVLRAAATSRTASSKSSCCWRTRPWPATCSVCESPRSTAFTKSRSRSA